MFKKKLSVLLIATSFTLVAPIILPVTTIVSAEEINYDDSIDDIEILKNEKYVQFEKELMELQNAQVNSFSTLNTQTYSIMNDQNYDEEVFSLIEKYEGAEVEVFINATSSYQTKFVRGGLNSFATTRAGMNALRSQMNTTATSLRVAGTAAGTAFGGPLGALVGLIGSGILSSNVRDGASGVASLISAGRTRGGSRVTLTEGFAITNINNTSQAVIR